MLAKDGVCSASPLFLSKEETRGGSSQSVGATQRELSGKTPCIGSTLPTSVVQMGT